MYKIRNKLTGQFSNGGSYPHWTKDGKIWKQRHHIIAHLRNVMGYSPWRQSYSIYADPSIIEIVTYTMTEAGTTSFTDMLKEMQ